MLYTKHGYLEQYKINKIEACTVENRIHYNHLMRLDNSLINNIMIIKILFKNQLQETQIILFIRTNIHLIRRMKIIQKLQLNIQQQEIFAMDKQILKDQSVHLKEF